MNAAVRRSLITEHVEPIDTEAFGVFRAEFIKYAVILPNAMSKIPNQKFISATNIIVTTVYRISLNLFASGNSYPDQRLFTSAVSILKLITEVCVLSQTTKAL